MTDTPTLMAEARALAAADISKEACAKFVATFSAKPGDEYDGHALAADMVYALRAAYEAEKERADCAEQSEAELVQGAKDLDLQIDDLKHKLDEARADRDALAELLARAAHVMKPFGEIADTVARNRPGWDHDTFDIGGAIGGGFAKFRRVPPILADIEEKLKP